MDEMCYDIDDDVYGFMGDDDDDEREEWVSSIFGFGRRRGGGGKRPEAKMMTTGEVLVGGEGVGGAGRWIYS
jgi:hypothetical protein